MLYLVIFGVGFLFGGGIMYAIDSYYEKKMFNDIFISYLKLQEKRKKWQEKGENK